MKTGNFPRNENRQLVQASESSKRKLHHYRFQMKISDRYSNQGLNNIIEYVTSQVLFQMNVASYQIKYFDGTLYVINVPPTHKQKSPYTYTREIRPSQPQ